jgi:hypothetical protein
VASNLYRPGRWPPRPARRRVIGQFDRAPCVPPLCRSPLQCWNIAGLPIIVHTPSPRDDEEFFKGRPEGRAIHRAIKEAVKDAGDVLMVTRLDRLARSTRDLLNTLVAITARKAGFRSLGDTWADTTTEHGRLMLTVLGGLAEFERDLIRTRTGEGCERAKARGVKLGRIPKLPEHQKREAIRRRDRRNPARDRRQLQRQPQHDFTASGLAGRPHDFPFLSQRGDMFTENMVVIVK